MVVKVDRKWQNKIHVSDRIVTVKFDRKYLTKNYALCLWKQKTDETIIYYEILWNQIIKTNHDYEVRCNKDNGLEYTTNGGKQNS